jgi:N-acyl-D-aspartate/D-glutamate deacylase
MPEYDVVIKDGMVFDGARNPRVRADVAVVDGKVADIGRIPASAGRKVLDASGLNVAPGFVDLHTHYDAQVFWDPYCTLSGWHGVTSVAIGNCGFGFAPVLPDERENAMRSMVRVEAVPYDAMREGMPWDWVTFPEFLDSLARTPKAVNLLPYVPIGPLLVHVLGREAAKAGVMPTEDQHRELARLLHEAMDAGGCGWSAQRLPPTGPAAVQRDWDGSPMPSDVMHDETCRVLAEVLAQRNQGVMQMTLTTNSPAHDMAHLEELATISGRPLLHNVVQAFEDKPHIHRKQLQWLARCRERGIPVYGQGVTTDAGFTFTFEDWNLYDDSDAWCEATTGSVEERLAKLADPARRAALKAHPPRVASAPLEQVTILSPKSAETARYKEMSVAQAGEAMGKHPIDAMLDIAVADNLKTEFFGSPPNTRLDLMAEIIQNPYTLFGVSDGGAHTRFLTAGRYPTEAITKFVREHNLISLEHAHYRLSALPAMLAGFPDRGVIKKGAPADIVVYDYETLESLPGEVAHDMPGGEWRRVQRANGYRYILVNGQITIENDRETGVHSGRLLRHGTGIRRPRAIAAE